MAEFVGGKSVVVDVGEPITFENKTDADFNVSYGVVFRKSGLYRVSVNGKHTSITIEPECKTGKWIKDSLCTVIGGSYTVRRCSLCESYYHDVAFTWNYCPNCGARMEGEEDR